MTGAEGGPSLPSSAESAPSLLGRELELTVLNTLLADVAAGRGGAALVEGEPGIGKTALLEAALASARARGCQVLRGSCDELEQRFPLSVMVAALGVDEGAPDPIRAKAAQGLSRPSVSGTLGVRLAAGDPVMAAVEQLVALVDRLCACGPLVLVVEDLHWADEASLMLWQRLCRYSTRQSPLLLLASCRSAPAPPGLDRLRRELRQSVGRLIRLDGLTADEVGRLVEARTGLLPGRRLAGYLAMAAGNPLYVRELLDALERAGALRTSVDYVELVDKDGPREAVRSLSDLIADRLDSLSVQVREALRMAALLGRVFSVSDLAVVTGTAPTALVGTVDEAIRAAVVEEQDGAWLRFRHGLLRQALYESIPTPLRVVMHQQAVEALIVTGAPPERVAELVLPVLDEADGWELGWIVENAGALANRAPDVGATLLEHALERLERRDPRRPRAEDALLSVCYYLARFEPTDRIARGILAARAEPDRVGSACVILVRNLAHHGRSQEALVEASEALDRGSLPPRWRGLLMAVRANLLTTALRNDEARDLAERALAEGERLADPFTVVYALHTLSLLSMWGDDLVSAVRSAERALDLAAGDDEAIDLRLLVSANRFAWLADLDRFAEAERGGREALAFAERNWTSRLGSIRVRFAEMAYWRGSWDDAQAELELAEESPMGLQVAVARHAYQALIAGRRGDWEAASEHFGVLGAKAYASESAWVRMLPPVLLARTLEAERAGSPERVVETLLPCFSTEDGRLVSGRHALLPDLVRAAQQCGDRAALRIVDRARAFLAPDGQPMYRRAGLLWCDGLLKDDPGRVLSAAELFRAADRRAWLGRALEDAAELQARGGDLASAAATLTESLRVHEQLGAVWDTRRAAARLRPYGVRSGVRGARRRPTTGWPALTDTEQRVVALVAQGLSNPDIAGRLLLSRRTVETHVSHILTKLQARSRREVAELVRGRAADAG